jgi:steroid delta-isomerase-like uncharacterized protein
MNTDWAKKWMGDFSRNGLGRAMAMYAENVQFEDLTLRHKSTSKADLQKFLASFFEAGAGDNRFIVSAFSGDSRGGAVEWTWRAKHEADFMGFPAAGKRTEVKGVSILTFADGKITSQRDYWDSGTVLAQLKGS